MDTVTKKQRSETMRAIKSSGTKIEVKLAKTLWQSGFRYRKNCKNILGKPDIVFGKYKIAVFCDSEFWHGKKLQKNPNYIDSNKKYWLAKIQRNMSRDKFVNRQLKKDGWLVLRFWGNDIEKNIDKCVSKIKKAVNAKL
ncbi:MAG: very short patch repair endonuclease [Elusimicrobia bacterium]|nr:very short patch repair endonuclease [Elusimicrobiota bacterium]